MYRRARVITFGDWRGVNNTQDPALIRDNELQSCVNFYVSNTGRLVARPGFIKLFDTPAEVVGIAKFQGDFYVACKDGKVYKWDGSSLSEIGEHEGRDVYFQVALGKLWIADGGKLKYWDGSTFGTIDDFLYHDELVGTGNGTTKSYAYSTSEVPVSPNSVKVKYTIQGTQYEAVDDGEGNISGTFLSGTVAYDTGAVNLNFDTAPDNGTEIRIIYSCSDVLDVKADFIEFRQERIWLAKGDSLYYSEIRDPSRWGFIKVASKDESDISAIAQLYDKLIVFKEGKDRGIYALSGNSEETFVVGLIAKGVSAKNREIVSVLGDLYFLDGSQLYSLKTIVEYGDIKPIQINQKFLIEDNDYILIPIPIANVIFGFAGYSGFTFTPTRKAFTSLASQEKITSALVVENEVYLGGENAVFKFADVNTDNGKDVYYKLSTKVINSGGFRRVLLKRFSLYGAGIDNAEILLSVFRRNTGYNLAVLSLPKVARYGIAVWDSDKWSNPSVFFKPLRQLIGGDYIYFIITSKNRFVLDSFSLEVS